ncbi:hypothetical protein NL676_016609 [Syzygium grande]|nr:hypothetical protein NL676_016609 [Syzygium grande]
MLTVVGADAHRYFVSSTLVEWFLANAATVFRKSLSAIKHVATATARPGRPGPISRRARPFPPRLWFGPGTAWPLCARGRPRAVLGAAHRCAKPSQAVPGLAEARRVAIAHKMDPNLPFGFKPSSSCDLHMEFIELIACSH